MDFWKSCKRYAWILGALAGVICLGLGAAQGQFSAIWNRAVLICLECIGIG